MCPKKYIIFLNYLSYNIICNRNISSEKTTPTTSSDPVLGQRAPDPDLVPGTHPGNQLWEADGTVPEELGRLVHNRLDNRHTAGH